MSIADTTICSNWVTRTAYNDSCLQLSSIFPIFIHSFIHSLSPSFVPKPRYILLLLLLPLVSLVVWFLEQTRTLSISHNQHDQHRSCSVVFCLLLNFWVSSFASPQPNDDDDADDADDTNSCIRTNVLSY